MRRCDAGHLMAAVPAGGSVRAVCVACLSRSLTGPGKLMRGCEMAPFRLLDVVTRLEATEGGGDFAPLDVDAVPSFDRLFNACEAAGVPFTAAGLRQLARRLSARSGRALAAVMAMAPAAVAEQVERHGLRPERVPA
jgi:hypothetical protein